MTSARPGVFLLQDDDKTLVPMGAVTFAAEVDFQSLLSRHPALLVGDQIDPENPRRFMLVKQEQSIGHDVDPSRWSVDHLFLDQDGVPTLVEVKRKSDTRLRREVVGQMLDYASNCQAHWTADGMRESLEATCAVMGASSVDALERLLEPGFSPEALWSNVQRNLQAGKIRMLFVADEIPTELRRIVEFLNEQMNPAEILAIELRQFAGQSLRTVVPVVYGQTQGARAKKASAPGAKWTEERFLERIDSKFPEAEGAAARAVLAWMKATGLPLTWGVGKEDGSVSPLLKPKGVKINPAYLSTEGRIWFPVSSLRDKPVFGDPATRRELLERFGQVSDRAFKARRTKAGSVSPFATIAADLNGTTKVIAAFDWLLAQVKAAR